MEKFNQLLEKLNSLNLKQEFGDWAECLPAEIYEEHFENNEYKVVAEDLDIDEHRWYETSITVVSVYGGLLGMRIVSKMYSESSDWSDIMWSMKFFEMVEVNRPTYIIKK